MKQLITLLIPLFLINFHLHGQTTETYNMRDGSTFTNDGVQWNNVTSTTSPDGKLRTQASTTKWHSTTYGIVFKTGNSLEIDVADGINTIRFYGSIYSAGTMSGSTTAGGMELGTLNVDIDTYSGMADVTGYYEFNYTGSASTLFFTFTGSNAYTPQIEITHEASAVPKTDVWDFGAVQLDEVLYNNMLNETAINAWYTYDGTQTPGQSGRTLPSFSAGDLTFVTNGTNDRLRTTNLNLTRYDQNIASSTNFTGRIYINAGGNTGRYLQLNLLEDDEVTIEARTDAGGTINFKYVANPSEQTDVVSIPAAETQLQFVAKSAGDYQVYDSSGKPSYFRVYRKHATYVTVSGSIDETLATGIPDGYTINFTNEAGKTFSATVIDGTYTIELPSVYTYSLSLGNANGYVITNGLSLEVNETTSIHNIVIMQVDLFAVTGNVSGLTDLTDLVLHFTPDPDAGTLYNPIVTLNTSSSSYSVNLEANIEYTITAEGVNDYEILLNSLTITGIDTFDIIFSPKPLHQVALNITGLTATQIDDLNVTFTNLNEDGYQYNFADATAVALRDGVYAITYSGLHAYPVELALTANLHVSGVDTSKNLNFTPITEWRFNDQNINSATAYKGLIFTGNVNVRGTSGDLNAGAGSTISIPVSVGNKIIVKDYYQSNYSIEGGAAVTNTSNSTNVNVISEYIYQGSVDGTVNISVAGTSYFVSIKRVETVAFEPIITVGIDKDYLTINEALNAISLMNRPDNERVTVLIDPGNYEEMLVINSPNVTLKNAASSPSIALLNAGVDIDENAVRITSYYGQKYNFYSQGNDNKWHADVLAVNLENGYPSHVNDEGSTNASYWNATVVVLANGFTAENLILENSFNQYISHKESQDMVVPKASDPIRPTDYGNTNVQNRGAGFVTQAAAIGIANNIDKVILYKCRVVGRQDTFYGGTGSRVAVYKGAIMGAVDYIYGGMTAVFYQSDLVLNTSDSSSDAAYITAAQQTSGRGFLMFECHVKSPIPGVETASTYGSKPGYFGRPWAPNTSEVVFYNTNIDASTYPGSENLSLISPVGWTDSLGGQSIKMYEYGTTENAAGIDNSENRATWSTVLTNPSLNDGTEITTFNFTKGNDNWDPFPELINYDSLGFNPINETNSVEVKAYQNSIFFSNIQSNTQIKIYNITGVAIQSFDIDDNTQVSFKDGFYLVHINNEQGQKTLKIIVH